MARIQRRSVGYYSVHKSFRVECVAILFRIKEFACLNPVQVNGYSRRNTGCETWSLTLREEGRLRVFENRVLRRVFGPKRDEVTGEWRKLHNEELSDLYSLPNIVRVVKSRRRK